MTISIKDTYNDISQHFDKTRIMIWQCVQKFIKSLNNNNIILDAGCGNGKNIKFMLDNQFNINNIYAFDLCDNFVDMCKNKYFIDNINNISIANILDIPYPDNMFDNIISIAVIHHLNTVEDRIKSIVELLRVLKVGGSILITVCSLEEPFYKHIALQSANPKDKHIKSYDPKTGDYFVPWKDTRKNLLGLRYYHFFTKDELLTLCNQISGISKIDYDFERGNHVLIIYK